MLTATVRPYVAKDKDNIRRLCCDTADCDRPIEGVFPDREIAADLLTSYYTEYEPSSIWIAEEGGEVIGYALGCMDNRRFGLVMNWILLPAIAVKAFKRGLFFDKKVWQVLGAMSRNWPRLSRWRKDSFNSHQAHLHISVSPRHRRRQAGARLIGAAVEQAAKAGATEISASVHSGNTTARTFFERMGFEMRERYPMVACRHGHVETYQSLLYVKHLA